MVRVSAQAQGQARGRARVHGRARARARAGGGLGSGLDVRLLAFHVGDEGGEGGGACAHQEEELAEDCGWAEA